MDDAFNPLPEDAHLLSFEEHQAYLQGQVAGKAIDFSTTPPTLVNPPPMSQEQSVSLEREWRSGELLSSDRLVTRHRDERDLKRATTLTAEQFEALLDYRQQLRDWPDSPEFPDAKKRPKKPAWLDQQIP